MTTLTQMERTATGWKCPRCGTEGDTTIKVAWAACNCFGLDAVTLPFAGSQVETPSSRGNPNLDLPDGTKVQMFAAPKPLVCAAPGFRDRLDAVTPRLGWVTEETATASERERLEAMATMEIEVLAAEVGVPLKSAMEAIETARHAVDAAMGIPDAFRYSLVVTLTPEQFRERCSLHGRMEKANDGTECEPFEAWANTTYPRKP